ncbi:MAG: bifunctional metallophosphatase/5'-nucleotidase [Prevotellaceae bacterium]|jgi:2',3'-cyclic-nucleotide 2'-phosphodiesterase (5'-nucleotidase family)|nr:bifunctional metallophosphatase/5'-nucleotidase [Prevotellaceae bacterium]
MHCDKNYLVKKRRLAVRRRAARRRLSGIRRVLVRATVGWSLLCGAVAAQAADDVTILFTHDLHSMFLPHRRDEAGRSAWRGGYARLHTAIRAARAQYPQSVLVDAGDFSSGSFFYLLFPSDCAELQLMAQMGYDALTLGNHDFDFGPDGLADALAAAHRAGVRLPIVAANVRLREASLARLNAAFAQYGVTDYTVLERDGKRIGVFGLIGDEAISNAPAAAKVEFEDRFTAAARMVRKLRRDEQVDLVICLSHSGTSADKQHSEDEQLAAAVPGLDVIVSGHTHTVLREPIAVRQTLIVSAGCYAGYLGVLTLAGAPSAAAPGAFRYRLIPIDSTLTPDAPVAAAIQSWKAKLNTVYFDSLGRYMDDTVAFNPTPLSSGLSDGASPAGRLVAEALRQSVGRPGLRPVAVVPDGVVRSDVPSGWLTEERLFDILSLGVGNDRKPGYPLVLVYLSGKELWDVCEIDASCAPLFPAAQLSLAGLKYTFNPHRLFCNKVTEVWVEQDDGRYAPPDRQALYPVVGDLYSLQMLGAIRRLTYGLLSLQPKDAQGQPVDDYQQQVLTLPNGQEYKEWIALSDYLRAFPDRRIPSAVGALPCHRTRVDDPSLVARLQHPNGFAWLVYGSLTATMAVVVALLVWAGKRSVRKMRRR